MTAVDLGLFGRLQEANRDVWLAYTGHQFVQQLSAGTLPEACFRHYLKQDYLFLIQFARAYGLAAYKSQNLADIRQAASGLSAIIDLEMDLHIGFCAEWGIDAAMLEAETEASETMAYTRYVLEKGLAGDLLDLHVALSPCIIGYAEIANEITRQQAHGQPDNPYQAWIEMYASDEYQAAATAETDMLDRLLAERGGAGRIDGLVECFGQATRLEVDFWQMGLDAALSI